MVQESSQFFFSFRLSDLITLLAFVLAYLKYRRDRENDGAERQKVREAQLEKDAARHAENKSKMDMLLEFQRDQLLLNRQRDEQISELKQQTAAMLSQAVSFEKLVDNMNRRLERLEGR